MSEHTPGPWTWWTSNSWKRLKHEGMDGRTTTVLTPYVASDRHPDLVVSDADMALIQSSPDLLALAKQYATECGDCSGARIMPGSHGCDEPCTACAFIWKVIDQAEGRTDV